MDTRAAQRASGSYAGTTFRQGQGPSVDDMAWCVSYADVDHVFRSKDWVQGGGGTRDSYEFIGDGLLALSGADHFQRRRIEAALFRRPNLRHYEQDILLPMLRERLDAARARAEGDGLVRLELRGFIRSCLAWVAAAFVGFDGLDGNMVGDYLDLIDQLGIGANMEWVVSDHREALQKALAYKATFIRRFFEPSWERRADLVARFDRGEIAEEELPLDLITVMIRNTSHFARWASDVYAAEVILFHGGPVNSVANAIPHAVAEISAWLARNPLEESELIDPAFLRLCCTEILRLHPPTPFFIRRAIRDTALPSGLRVSAGDYISLDIIAASRDPAAFGPDADGFNPYRSKSKGVRSTGLAFGGGPHTCIAMGMAVGDSSGGRPDSAEQIGLMITCLRELYHRGIRPDPGTAPEKNGVNTRDEYSFYWVVFDA